MECFNFIGASDLDAFVDVDVVRVPSGVDHLVVAEDVVDRDDAFAYAPAALAWEDKLDEVVVVVLLATMTSANKIKNQE